MNNHHVSQRHWPEFKQDTSKATKLCPDLRYLIARLQRDYVSDDPNQPRLSTLNLDTLRTSPTSIEGAKQTPSEDGHLVGPTNSSTKPAEIPAMFSFMTVAHSRAQKPARRAEVADERGKEEKEEEELRRRNEVLERELREGREREEELRIELERMKQRLSMVEEAEERLCAQLGELEAEAVVQARAYHVHVKALADQLAHARGLLSSCEIHSHHGLILVGESS